MQFALNKRQYRHEFPLKLVRIPACSTLLELGSGSRVGKRILLLGAFEAWWSKDTSAKEGIINPHYLMFHGTAWESELHRGRSSHPVSVLF